MYCFGDAYYSRYSNETLANVERLYADLYDADLKRLIDSSKHLTPSALVDCQSESFPDLLIRKLDLRDGWASPLSFWDPVEPPGQVMFKSFDDFLQMKLSNDSTKLPDKESNKHYFCFQWVRCKSAGHIWCLFWVRIECAYLCRLC